MLSNVNDEKYDATHVVCLLLLALPWLAPLAIGPAIAVPQGLAVWLGAALCWIAWEFARALPAARIRTLAAAWLLAASLSAGMGLVQYLGYAAQFSPWVSFVDAGQAYANLRQRNQLATLLAIGLAALLWWQLTGAAQASAMAASTGRRWLVCLVAIPLVAANAATGSRTGMLQLLVLLALGLVWRRGRALLLWVLLGYALAAFALPRLIELNPWQSGILGRFGEVSAPCSSRLTLWSNVLHLMAQKPWLGWGWGELRYAHFVTLYSGDRFCEILGNAHNLPLHLAVELGIPFALAVCGTLTWLLLRAKPWREQDPTRQMAWNVLAVLALHSLLEYPLWYGPFQLAAVSAVWILWQTRPSPAVAAGSGPVLRTTRPAPATVALATVLAGACCYVAWDYWRISQIYLPASQRAAFYRDDTLDKIRASWLFADQVKFAELGITTLTADNAGPLHALATELLHFSPEASVAQKLIDSANLLGQDAEADYFAQRFQAAYPQEYAAWRAASSGTRHKTP
jgi:O-antigen ligase